jgi:preprotein translocase subunit SecG
MYEFILIIHIAVCFLLILTVLLQSGKGAGLNLFGGGGDTLFSAPSGSSFMRQFTSGLAMTFAFTSLFLTLFASRSNMRSVTSRIPAPPPVQAPAEPAAPAAPGDKAAPAKPAASGPVRPVKPGEGIAPKAAATPAAPAKK